MTGKNKLQIQFVLFVSVLMLVFLATASRAATPPPACSNSGDCVTCHHIPPSTVSVPIQPRPTPSYPTLSEIKALGGSQWLIAGPKAGTKILVDCYGPPNKKIRKWWFWNVSSANHLRFCNFFKNDVAYDIMDICTIFTGSRVLSWDPAKNVFYENGVIVKFSWKEEMK